MVFFQRRRFFKFFQIISLGHGQFGPQGLDWQDLCREPLTLLHTKYVSSGPHSFRDYGS